MADDAGALLVRSGLVSSNALDEARARVASIGGTLGEQLVTGGVIADDALTDFYRSRLLVPQVNPNMLARLTPKVIATLPSDMAIELRAIPVSFDGDNNLTVAMSDPSDRHAVDEIAFFTGAYVVRAVATQMQIAWCLAHYYGHVTALGQRLLHASGSASPITAAISAAAQQPPRTEGLTDKVDAPGHRASAPIIDYQTPLIIMVDDDDATSIDEMPPMGPGSSPKITATSESASDRPQAHSASEEIRSPVRRAASVRPPMPQPDGDDDDDEPLIVIERGAPDEDDTGVAKPAPRRRVVKSDPPELYARAGEVDLKSGVERLVDLDEPRIVVDEAALSTPTLQLAHRVAAAPPQPPMAIAYTDADTAALIRDRIVDNESQPILLERPRATREQLRSVPDRADRAADTSDDDTDTDETTIVVLDARKPKPKPKSRPERRTRVGLPPAPIPVARQHRDTEATGMPTMIAHRELDRGAAVRTAEVDDEATTLDVRPAPRDGTTSDQRAAPPPPAGDDDLDPHVTAPSPEPAPSRPRTSVMSAIERHATIPDRSSEIVPPHLALRRIEYNSIDDGWGPPGTTIPPPLLGAIPGSEEDEDAAPSSIPMSSVDSSPLIVGPAAPPPAAGDSGGRALARALEQATARAIEVIRQLERAESRDQVVDVLVAHLAENHRRAGFFVTRPVGSQGVTELTVFSMLPRPAVMPFATLRLDRPSTLQDVVGTRLPYRGPMHDDASRTFLAAILGACPPEILLVPVAVRERVVGVLFGEHRQRQTFDDQLALTARAAGMALERVLKSKRG